MVAPLVYIALKILPSKDDCRPSNQNKRIVLLLVLIVFLNCSTLPPYLMQVLLSTDITVSVTFFSITFIADE